MAIKATLEIDFTELEHIKEKSVYNHNWYRCKKHDVYLLLVSYDEWDYSDLYIANYAGDETDKVLLFSEYIDPKWDKSEGVFRYSNELGNRWT